MEHAKSKQAAAKGAHRRLGVATTFAVLGFAIVSCGGTFNPLENEIPTWTKQGMLAGAVSSESTCVREDRVWVRDGRKGFCIRYFKNDAALAGQVSVLFFTGDYVGSDWDTNGQPIRATYGLSYDGIKLFRDVVAWSRISIESPLFLVSRPGALGSSGDHKDKYKYRESRIMNAAIDQIKKRYGIEEIALAGQSGGATLVANILPKRSDVRCAVMASGAVALHRYASDGGFGRNIYIYWEDPIDSAQKIDDSSTAFYVLAGKGDKIRPVGYQAMYVDILTRKKLDAHLLVLSKSRNPHNLQEEALRVADACARKQTLEQIKQGLTLAETP